MKNYIRYCTVTILILQYTFLVQAQEPIFAFAYNELGKPVSLDSESSEAFSYKFENTQAVLNDLIEAKGSFNQPRPKLIMNNAEQKPAWIDLSKAEIVLEEKAYDICMSFGKDSLAALSILLSHELIHYYEKHDWHHHFLHHYGSNVDYSKNEEPIRLELEADQMGGFLSIMAGYNTQGIHEGLLTKIYKAYKLDNTDSKNNYPSLTERIELANKASVLLNEMQMLFDMSSYLSVIGEYETASKYLDEILIKSKFQSRELYNNKGVLLASSALAYFPKSQMPYYLSFELELESRLSRKNNDLKARKRLLDEAATCFKTALILDEDYHAAAINLSSVEILRADHFEAEYLCNKLLRKLNSKENAELISSIKNNLAVMAALDGDKQQAEKLFLEAKDLSNNNIAKANANILSNKSLAKNQNASIQSFKIDNLDLNSLFSKIMRDEERANFAKEINTENCFYQIDKENSSIFINLNSWGDKGYSFFQIGEEIDLANNAYNLSNTIQDIQHVNDFPASIISSSTKSMHHFKESNLIVETDAQNRIQRFIVYKNQSN